MNMKQAPWQVHTGTNTLPGSILMLRRLAAAYLTCEHYNCVVSDV